MIIALYQSEIGIVYLLNEVGLATFNRAPSVMPPGPEKQRMMFSAVSK